MKSKITKISTALLLAGVTAATTSCNLFKKKIPEDTIVIHAANLGYGLDWLKDLTDRYSAKTGVQFKIDEAMGQEGVSGIITEIQSKSGRSDILVGRSSYTYHTTIYKGRIEAANGQKYDCAFEDLTDVYNSVYEGENAEKNTIAKKINSNFLDYYTVNGKQYGLPWANGFMSFARNVDVWNNLGMTNDDVPYTTNQMFKCFDKIFDKVSDHSKISPLIYSRTDEYYTSIPNVWFGQYEGKEAINNYIQGKGPSGQLDGNLFTYDGQVKALEVLETIADNEVGNALRPEQYQYGEHKWTHASSASAQFTQMQNYFLAGGSVFCLNGTWLEIEMSKKISDVKGKNIDFIKIPVISALADDKMAIGTEGEETYIADKTARDNKLGEIVKFVDAHPTVGDNESKPAGVSDEDVEIVREARLYNSVQGTDYDHMIVIPSWSNNKTVAKDFLKYMYSDEGLQAVYDKMEGHHLPAQKSTGSYETNFTLTPFRKSANAILDEGHFDGFSYLAEKCKMFSIAQVHTNFSNGISSGNPFTSMRDENKSAEEIINANDANIKSRWDSIKGQIGE